MKQCTTKNCSFNVDTLGVGEQDTEPLMGLPHLRPARAVKAMTLSRHSFKEECHITLTQPASAISK